MKENRGLRAKTSTIEEAIDGGLIVKFPGRRIVSFKTKEKYLGNEDLKNDDIVIIGLDEREVNRFLGGINYEIK